MAKLDWGKASMRETDPARVQRTHDFVEPDRVIISVQKLTKTERKKLATEQNARRRKKPVKKKVVAKPKPMLIAKLPKKQRPQLSEEEKLLQTVWDGPSSRCWPMKASRAARDVTSAPALTAS